MKAPWWVEFVAKVGVPAALAVYFVYWLTTDVSVVLKSIDTRIAEQITIEKQERRRAADMLLVICENTASSPEQRSLCAAVARAFPEGE